MDNWKGYVSYQEAGKTLLIYLKDHLKESGKAIKRFLDGGFVQCNGMIERFGSIQLKEGDFISFTKGKEAFPSFSLPILWEDEHMAFCQKPPGLISKKALFSPLLPFSPFLVHRLDKGTSGVIAIAKSFDAQKKLENLFKQREVEKIYFALVVGEVDRKEGKVINCLERKGGSGKEPIWGSSERGALAITTWRRLRVRNGLSFLQCHPKTGRTHQIRVHLSELGHPILGDLRYGREKMPKGMGSRLFLHAYSLSLSHPFKKEKIYVIAPIPSSFQKQLAVERRL